MTRDEFRNIPLTFDKRGIVYQNDYLMLAWEKDAIQCQAESIIEKCKPESVLEIGFGLGYTAEIFKKAKRHLVVEPHPVIAQNARDAGYDVWEGFIQDFRSDEHWDVVYDDRFDMVFQEEGIPTKVSYSHFIPFKLCTHTYHYRQPISIL